MSSQRDELDHDYGAAMQNAWEGGIGDFSDDTDSKALKFDAEGIPTLSEYAFGTTILSVLSLFLLTSIR
jgi:peroxin-5